MVTFTELAISDDKKTLSYDLTLTGATNEKITSVKLINFDNLNTNGTIKNSSEVLVADDGSDEHSYSEHTIGAAELTAYLEQPDFDKKMFFLIVTYNGTLGATEIFAVIDWEGVYEIGMPYVAQIAAKGICPCDPPAGFETFLILWNSLKLAIAAGDYARIADIWKMFMRVYYGAAYSSPDCGCN